MQALAQSGASPGGRVFVGTAGWLYEDWKGIVYPAGSREHPLRLLSSWFGAVEVNATFYRPLPPETTAKWPGLVPPESGFVFLAKLWQRFTHERAADRPAEEDVRTYCDGIEPLLGCGRLGALLAQFPWSFKRTRENRLYLARLIDAFAAYPLAVEFRHESWDCLDTIQGLASYGVAFCNIDQPTQSNGLGPTEHVTAPFGYVRLHGRNAANWFRQDAGRDNRYDYLYGTDELADWLARIHRMRSEVDELFVITNNHYRGQAVVNAFELQQGLDRGGPPPPPQLAQAYPHLMAEPPA